MVALVVSAVAVAAVAGVALVLEKGDSSGTGASEPGQINTTTTHSPAKACHWGYENGGVAEWAGMSCIGNNKCGGTQQSPVALTTPAKAEPSKLTLPTALTTTTKYSVNDTGHAVMITIEDEDYKWTVVDAEKDPPTNYKLVQFHFHIGTDDKKGAEHTIDGKTYPLEVHLVLRDSKYSNFREAVQHPGGVAVMAALLAVGAASNPEDALEPIVKRMEKPDETDGTELDLKKFFGGLEDPDYLTYSGSFTTPPCTEGIKWFVFKQKATVKTETLAQFRNLIAGHSKDNFRPPQPLNGREVKHFGAQQTE